MFEVVKGLTLNRYSKGCPFTKESASPWGPWGKGRLTYPIVDLRRLKYAHKLYDNVANEAYSIQNNEKPLSGSNPLGNLTALPKPPKFEERGLAALPQEPHSHVGPLSLANPPQISPHFLLPSNAKGCQTIKQALQYSSRFSQFALGREYCDNQLCSNNAQQTTMANTYSRYSNVTRLSRWRERFRINSFVYNHTVIDFIKETHFYHQL